MKGKKCIKFLLSFIILALSFVLYSKDTNALQGLEYIDSVSVGNSLCPFQTTYTDGTVVAEGTCPIISASTNIRNFRKLNFNAEKGKIYEISFQVLEFQSTSAQLAPYFRFPAQSNQDFSIVGFDYSNTSNLNSYTYSIFVKALRDTNYLRVGMGSDGTILYYFDIIGDSARSWPIRFSSIVNVYTENSSSSMNQKDDQDRDNLEQQSSSASSDSDSSAEDAEQTGTTLLGAFSAFVNALTNASPSNCVLDMDLGNLDMGNVDFCQLSPPAGFQAIASVFLILFCVPLSIATARKLISLFRSFQ